MTESEPWSYHADGSPVYSLADIIRKRAAATPAGVLWETRHLLRARLVAETRRRLRASWRQRGASDAELTWIDDVLDEHALTIGFARRVPSYKRLTLMLNDPEQLSRLLNDPDKPLQIVVATRAARGSSSSWSGSPTRPTCAAGSCSCLTTTWPWRTRWCKAATSG